MHMHVHVQVHEYVLWNADIVNPLRMPTMYEIHVHVYNIHVLYMYMYMYMYIHVYTNVHIELLRHVGGHAPLGQLYIAYSLCVYMCISLSTVVLSI